MTEMTTQTHIGLDGVMHLDIPTNLKDADVNVTVTIEPAINVEKASPQKHQEWLDFIDRTAGAWQGNFERDQGVAEERNWPTDLYSDSDSDV